MALCCTTFFALGVLMAAIGPALPELAANADTSIAAVGATVTALFLGGLVSQLSAGPLNDRFGERPMILAGHLCLAAGAIGLILSRSLPATLLAGFVVGLGDGALNVSVNVLIALVFARRGVSALNLVNIFYGVGAIFGPLAAGAAAGWLGSALPALGFAAILLLAGTPFIRLLADAPRHTVSGPTFLRSGALWVLGVILLLYVGVEIGTGAWNTLFFQRSAGFDYGSATVMTAGFWLALAVGRLIGAIVGGRISEPRLLPICLAGGIAGAGLQVAGTGDPLLPILGVLLLGISLGPVFPIVVALTTARFPAAPAAATSIVLAMGGMGGLILPWLQGAILDNAGPRPSVLLILLLTSGMAIAYATSTRLPR